MHRPITLTDDGELTEAVDVPDRSTGVSIHFTTGRDVSYPVATPPSKGKRVKCASLLDSAWTTWLLVIGCLCVLTALVLLISIGR
ncbi:MAG: hypothetical protein ACYDBJ_26510 [Aggregatilineales bacterium]